jgi:hypothetical protein
MAICFLISHFISAQNAMYRVLNGELLVITTKDGQQNKYVNSNILINLNYQNGDFLLTLNNTDFYKTDSVYLPEDTLKINQQREFKFSGILPINEILYQQTTEHEYDIELELTNDDLNIDQNLNINMTITRPNSSGGGNLRNFIMNGKLDNSILQLPALSGFDDEIEFYIQFTAYPTSS